ncbi:serine/threonine protein kinase [Motilibacter peucedani]|uniref:Serine/threonine protein kinase n=1 Tax=Motilibacter peucedani TaxID=598650 RepID=A0A420XRP0_9ACTN|nr:serine/threonine-protein kinase [Motilibacter peucedani]RKS77563.1 serine/threonine protein kinase [Motilibacter peucedani]
METGERLGPYRLLTRIGEGGMGVVHLALDADGRAVAVKVLRPHLVTDENGRRRLAREVEALRRVVGPHVAEVVDADVAGPSPYVVMRYVQGRSLPERVERSGPLRGDELHAVVVGLARALGAIHRVGVVHRDLKPANVLLADGEPVVVDFGLAQFSDDTRLTATGMLLGTPGYLAPEAIGGAAADASADVHGWGATAVYAATGRPPYGTGAFEVVLARVLAGEPDLDGVPGWLLPVVEAALAPDPADRPDAQELLLAVQDAAMGFAPRLPARTPRDRADDATELRADGREHATEHVAALAAAPVPPLPRQDAGPEHTRLETWVSSPAGWAVPDDDRPHEGTAGGHLDDGSEGVGPARLVAHPLLLLVALAAAAAAAVFAPVAAAAGALGVSVSLRAVDGAASYLARRRSAYGRRRADALLALASLPWYAVRGTLTTLATLPQAVLGALAPGAVVLASTHGLRPEVDSGAFDGLVGALAAGALLAVFYGPASAPLRRGFDRVAEALAPGRLAPVLTGLVLLGAGALLVSVAVGERTRTWPVHHTPEPVASWVDTLRSY